MESIPNNNERKAMVGFKCSPALRVSLTHQAEQLGITLSYHIETRLMAEEVREQKLQEKDNEIKKLEERIAFYEENPLLLKLYKANQGRTITYQNKDDKTTSQQVNSLQDVFTIITNSFKINDTERK